MSRVSVMCCIDGIADPSSNFHDGTPDAPRAAVFVSIGDVTIWSHDAPVFLRLAAVFTDAARQLDESGRIAEAEPS